MKTKTNNIALIHYADQELTTVISKNQYDKPQSKPVGLWVSVEGRDSYTWKQWCKAESFCLDRLQYAHRVVLRPTANILYLTTTKEILGFTKEYLVPLELDVLKGFGYNSYGSRRLTATYNIDWKRVAAKYQGIIIAPYNWELRLSFETQWYYGFDAASGCLWANEAIQSFTCIKRSIGKKQE